jgi:hypothetical protein
VTNITVEPVAGPVQSYTFPDLPPGDYQFRVRALFPDGVVGEWSHVLGATAEVLGTVGVSVSTGLPLPTVTAEVQGAAQVTITAGLPLPTVAAEVQGAAPPAEVTITAGLPLPTVAAEVEGASAPAVELVGVSSNFSTNSTTTAPVDVPAGTQTGDLLVAFIASRGGALDASGASGWTTVAHAQTGSSNLHAQVWALTRVAEDEPASYVLQDPTGAVGHAVVLAVYRGAVFDAADARAATDSSMDTPSVAGTAGGVLLACWSGRVITFAAEAVPAGMTERDRLLNGHSSGASTLAASEALAVTAATGTRTATYTAAHGRVANAAVTLKPA